MRTRRLLARAAWTAIAVLLTPDPGRADGAIFVDRAAASGVDFVHFNGMSGELYFPENVGAGAALFDYDQDGDLDLYLVQGAMLGGKALEEASFPPRHPLPLTDRLYRNDFEDGTLRFTDVTAESGLAARGYGMGVAVGDVDNDGWPDVYVTNFGRNELWSNTGHGGFRNVTREAGVGERRWSVPAAFADLDQDGWLDLYVGNYVDWSFANHKECVIATGARDYCHPLSFKAQPDRIFRNTGRGASFTDMTSRWGADREFGGALGVVTADFDGDGRLDVYVANDKMPNQLWLGQSDGTFVNEALLGGCSVSGDGQPEASMGVDAGDFDNDGDVDLFMAHLNAETNTLYVNDGRALFRDTTRESSLGAPSLDFTGFGAAWLDYDNDSWLDLLVVNGAVQILEELARRGEPYPLHQPNQLFRNVGGRRFEEVSARAGEVFELSEVSRGVALGDVDNDGDMDAVVTNNNGPVRLLVNQVGHAAPWLGLRLVDVNGRDALGARVAVERAGAPTLWRRARTDGSFASANDPRVLVGLGGTAEVREVRVHWPGGHVEAWRDVPAGRYTTLTEGTGQAVGKP